MRLRLSFVLLCLCSGLVCAQQELRVRTIALSGDPVPGLDAGLVYSDFAPVFRPVTINDAGKLTFISRIAGPGIVSDDNAIVLLGRDPGQPVALLARSGDPAPGFPAGVDYQFITGQGTQLDEQPNGQPNNRGGVLYQNRIVGPGINADNDDVYFADVFAPSIGPVAREGDAAPGFPGLTWEITSATLTGAGAINMFATLTGPGVVEENNEALFVDLDGSGFVPRLREGDPAPGFGPGNVVEFIGATAYNDAGGLAFSAQLAGPGVTTDTSSVLYAGFGQSLDPADLTALAREGEQVPGLPSGVVYDRSFVFRPLLITNANEVAFVCDVTDTEPLPDRRSVFMVGLGGPDPRPLAITEAQIPGLPQGIQIRAFLDAAYSATGHAACIALLEGPGVTPGVNDEALFADIGGAGLGLVARTGQQADGAPAGVVYESFNDIDEPVIGDDGPLIYRAALSGGRVAIYALDAKGVPTPLVATGQVIDVNNAPGFEDFRQVAGVVQRVSSNNRGQVACVLSFTDGTGGVFVLQLVEPCPADFNNNGLLTILDVVAFITNWNMSGPGADFNEDGSVNILDVVAFIGVWNAGCP